MHSLAGLLRTRAAAHPERNAFVMVNGFAEPFEQVTFGGLDRASRHIAARLLQLGKPGDRVLIACAGIDFIRVFFGCQYAGMVAVPVSPPTRRGHSLRRAEHVLADCGAVVVVADRAVLDDVASWLEELPDARIALVAANELACNPGALDQDIAAVAPEDPDALSFLQYTSGTTGSPKGVMVRTRNIMANLELIRVAMRNDSQTVVGGWLPLFHDMGLIGLILQPVYLGCVSVLMSPTSFLKRPGIWLQAVSRYRISNSGGPNFGYEHVLDRARDRDLEGIDLTCWRVCFSGSEPPRSETMQRFEHRFLQSGFRPEAFYPCYGMAETTLFVSGGRPEEVRRRIEVDPEQLRRGVATRPASNAECQLVVSSGVAGGFELAITDPSDRRRLADGRVGEIWLRGESIGAGYWNREELSRETFGAEIAGEPGTTWLRTGDLGFVVDSELFVSGRLKDVIIVAGRNLYPQDIEYRLREVDPRFASGTVVAFAWQAGVTEAVAVLLETSDNRDGQEWSDLGSLARSVVGDEFGAPLARFTVGGKGAVLRTTSGKLRRDAARRQLEGGGTVIIWEDARRTAGTPI